MGVAGETDSLVLEDRPGVQIQLSSFLGRQPYRGHQFARFDRAARGLGGKKCLEFPHAARFDSAQDAPSGAQHRSSRIAERARHPAGFGGIACGDHSFSRVPLLIPLEKSAEKFAQVENSTQKSGVYGLIDEGSGSWVHVSKCPRG